MPGKNRTREPQAVKIPSVQLVARLNDCRYNCSQTAHAKAKQAVNELDAQRSASGQTASQLDSEVQQLRSEVLAA